LGQKFPFFGCLRYNNISIQNEIVVHPQKEVAMDNPELESLLSKHRLSFHWNGTGKTWFLIGQIKGSNTLQSSKMEHADDIDAAKRDAVRFIHDKFSVSENTL
jgi:hypothetical protein